MEMKRCGVSTLGIMVTFIFVYISFVMLVDASCRKVKAYNDDTLDDYIFDAFKEVTGTKTLSQCTVACQTEIECATFCFHQEEERCRLHDNGFLRTSDGVVEVGWKCYMTSDGNCPLQEGFAHHRGSNLCIHLSPVVYYFTPGHAYCENKNSKMISLQTTTKLQAFLNLLETVFAGRFTRVHIGLGKTAETGWTWADGTPLGTEANWIPGQPLCDSDKSNICDCVDAIGNDDWKWNDNDCISPNIRVICEIELQ